MKAFGVLYKTVDKLKQTVENLCKKRKNPLRQRIGAVRIRVVLIHKLGKRKI